MNKSENNNYANTFYLPERFCTKFQNDHVHLKKLKQLLEGT